jgi:hypothetical protein
MIGPIRCGQALRALWLLASLAFASGAAAAKDVPLGLLKSYEGNINFAGTQVTLLTKANGSGSCDVAPANTIKTAKLELPLLSDVLSAHLYWTGSGNPDNSVVFEGKTFTAPEGRRYFSNAPSGGLTYFGGAADVTSVVAAKGSGSYDFSGLTVANGKPYCDNNKSLGVVGGFALVVVYANGWEPFRTVNLYEGYQALQNREVKVTLGNFRIPTPLGGARARVGYLVWEGDGNGSHKGEPFEFNGIEMTNPPYSTSGKPFNASSSINSDNHSFGIDFDAYDVTTAIEAGQTSGSMLFRTGDDLVLLNAAVLAFPSKPRADLALEIGRSGPLHVGRSASYTLKVSNSGPNADGGPVTLTVTLPGQLNYVGVDGSGWKCPNAGLVLTCTYEGMLASKSELPPLNVNVTVSSTGTVKVDAAVEGTHDPNMANNSASDTTVVAEASSGGYVFTEGACKLGEQIGDSAHCRELGGWFPGGAPRDIYITAVSTDGTGRAVTATPPPARLRFALACVNPGAGAGPLATYAGKQLPECTPDGRAPATDAEWSAAVEVTFSPGFASSRQTFLYHDVGQLQLRMRDDSAGRVSASQAFVSRPTRLSLAVFNDKGGGNPGTTSLAGAGFARAGEKLTVQVSALLADGKIAPNFGNEKPLPAVQIAAGRHESFRKGEELQDGELPPVASDTGTMSNLGSGVIGGSDFRWNEVGVVIMQALLDKYLGTGGKLDSEAATVGRFYPAYFTTTIATPFSCLARMRCPDPNSARAVAGAVYSGQPFEVSVAAFAEGGVGPLKNFAGQWIPKLRLRAFDTPGGDAGLHPSEKQGLQGGSLPGAIAEANVSYLLPVRFDADAPRVTGWSAPAAIYLRADADDERSEGGSAAAKPITISSLRPDPAASKEGGAMVVNGRLQPANVFSAPTLPTPVRLDAQYWTGSAWENNTVFDDPSALSGAVAQFWHCRRGLRATPVMKRDNCDQAAFVSMPRPLALTGGTTKYWLKAGKSGSAMLQMNLPEWLPSAYGRVVFGQYNSPVIYMRELY